MDDFALLGDTQKRIHTAGRCGVNAVHHVAATAAHRATPAVKKADGDALLTGELGQFPLRTLQRPARGRNATVLVAVGVANHDELPIAPRSKMRAIGLASREFGQDPDTGIQVVDCFQQGRDVEWQTLVGRCQAGHPREQHDR